jgi:protein Mpv17
LKGLKKGNKQVRDKIIETMIADVVVWPLATGINLWYVPLQYQVLYTNIICLFWDVALCHITKE